MLTTCVITAYFWHPHLAKAPPRGPPLEKIYVIISLEMSNADKAAEIPVTDILQENDPKDLDDEAVEALVPENPEDAMLQLGGYSDNSEETPWKAVGKYNHLKIRKGGEEVIQAASDLVDLEQVIKGADEVRRKNRGDDLYSMIK